MKTIIRWAALAAVAIGIYAVFSGFGIARADGPAAGTQAPAFSATDINGKPVSLADYKGKVLLLDFWATWCPPCRAEVPNVVKTYNAYHPKGFEILGISVDRSKDDLVQFIRENKMTWRQVYDTDNNHAITMKYGVRGIPTMVLIDGTTGKVIATGLRGPALEKAVANAVAARRK